MLRCLFRNSLMPLSSRIPQNDQCARAFSSNPSHQLPVLILPDQASPIGIGGRVSPPLPHHRTCGSASGGSARLSQNNIQQSRKTERVEVSNREGQGQGGTVRQPPRAVGTTGGLCRKVRSDVPLAEPSKPHLAPLPLLPDGGSQPTANPLLQPLQHRRCLAVAEIALPPL